MRFRLIVATLQIAALYVVEEGCYRCFIPSENPLKRRDAEYDKPTE